MGSKLPLTGAAVALAALCAPHARAQAPLQLPQIDVTATRLSGAITGASTSVITADDIEKSPAQNLPDILAQSAGVQVTHLLGGPTGTQDMVDLRGFGAFAQSNVLVLLNGRRFQDFDLQGFDFSSIPLNSIARVEITRGNSGAVLYGDGAIGGVINIVTKNASSLPGNGRVEGIAGTYGYEEGRISAGRKAGPWSISVFGNAVASSGYRQNSKLTQGNSITELNYKDGGWTGYLNVGIDGQHQGLPAGLPNLPLVYPITLDNPRASVTPFDWGSKKDVNVTGGVTYLLAPGADLIVDGGVRRKFQRSEFFNYFNTPTFTFDPASAVPMNYINTGMTTTSLTPRLDLTHQVLGMRNRLLAGVDLYDTQYGSDRYQAPGALPIHEYEIRQTTTGYYGMDTLSLLPNLDVSLGARAQRNRVEATDGYNASVDPNAFFYASSPQAAPFSAREWQHAAHVGIEYRIVPALALFGRAARAFRLPNADERVGAGNPFNVSLPANFDLKTQTSQDVEGGVRVNWQRFNFESSVYRMNLKNEIHFIPALMVDVNLDPTKRSGWENSASYQLTDDIRLRGGAAETRAVFREGPFAGKDIPLVSRWTGNAGLSWNIWQKLLVLDVSARFWGKRRMDNDQANVQPEIPANATADVKIGGEYGRFFWSAAALNVFDVKYYDYAIASAFTPGYFTAYPQPGRIFEVRAGATF
jgi:iron complex outermembrane receptor protein